LVGDVAREGGHPGACGRVLKCQARRLCEVLWPDVASTDVATFAGQLPYQLAPHTGPPAGDDGNLALEAIHPKSSSVMRSGVTSASNGSQSAAICSDARARHVEPPHRVSTSCHGLAVIGPQTGRGRPS